MRLASQQVNCVNRNNKSAAFVYYVVNWQYITTMGCCPLISDIHTREKPRSQAYPVFSFHLHSQQYTVLGRGIHQSFILGLKLTVKNWGKGSGAKLDLSSSHDTFDNLGSYIKIPVYINLRLLQLPAQAVQHHMKSLQVLKVDQMLTVCTSAWRIFLKMWKGSNLDVILQCLTMGCM